MNGEEPLPIFAAIRHGRLWKERVDSEHPFREPDHAEKEHKEATNA